MPCKTKHQVTHAHACINYVYLHIHAQGVAYISHIRKAS